MDIAQKSRYWCSYRDSKTFTLTIYIYEAHLGVSAAGGSNGGSFHAHTNGGSSVDTSLGSSGGAAAGLWDTKIVVSLPKDPMGERHETSRAGKTSNPVWDQVVVFKDIDYSELVRVEMRRPRKIGENPVLASVEFEVHDVMGLSLKEGASVFQLECDRTRARYGVILLAFRFDPPVAADVLGELDGAGSVTVPRGVTAAADHDQDGDAASAPAWGTREPSGGRQVEATGFEVAEPVYINVEGHFACLLLDDDAPIHPCKPTLGRPSSYSSDVVQPRPRSQSRGSLRAGSGYYNQHRLSTVSQHSSTKSENNVYDTDNLIHGRGSAVWMARHSLSDGTGRGGGGGGVGSGGDYGIGIGGGDKRRSAVRDLRQRPVSLGGNLAIQLSALGLGVGGGGGNKVSAGKPWRPASVDSRRGVNVPDTARMETPQQRWSMPRRRPKPQEHGRSGLPSGGGGSRGGANRGSWKGSADNNGGKRSRSRGGWAHGFLKSPTLGGLRRRRPSPPALVMTTGAAAAAATGAPPAGASMPNGEAMETPSSSVDSSGASTVRAGEESLKLGPPPPPSPLTLGRPPGSTASSAASTTLVSSALCGGSRRLASGSSSSLSCPTPSPQTLRPALAPSYEAAWTRAKE